MNKSSDQTKLAELAVKQNLLLWQISQDLLKVDKQIGESFKKQNVANT